MVDLEAAKDAAGIVLKDQLQGSVEEMAADMKSLKVGDDNLGQQVAVDTQLTREGVRDGMTSMTEVRCSDTP